METIGSIHRPKFAIDRSMKVAMAGSCFAQQICRHLRARGFTVSRHGAAAARPRARGSIAIRLRPLSARHGNIYTARLLRQLAEEAFAKFVPGDAIWQRDGRYYDALRPTVEPDGLASARAVREQRRFHLRQVREVIGAADVFVFTLGLNETWMHAKSGTVYPTAPGVVCGAYDPAKYLFKNLSAPEIHDDLCAFFALAKEHNPRLKLVLTVSPQRPIATATGQHVLMAAAYSKAVLRAAAGQFESEHGDVDYFPSYEMVTSPVAGNRYFNPNLRTVTDAGVALAMDAFFASYAGSRAGRCAAGACGRGARHPRRRGLRRRARRGLRAVKRVCVIGDSHTAAIKHGWWGGRGERVSRYRDHLLLLAPPPLRRPRVQERYARSAERRAAQGADAIVPVRARSSQPITTATSCAAWTTRCTS